MGKSIFLLGIQRIQAQSEIIFDFATSTKLGYATFFCSQCKHILNERTGTPFNELEFPTDIVLLVVLWRLRYKLSLRDGAAFFLERGFVFTQETARDWEERFAPLIADHVRKKR